MSDQERSDPDRVLSQIKNEELRAKRGQLKLFLGMVAGVGKTCAMLEAAHRKRKEGVDVVVAIVETHGRQFTEKLVRGLELLPRAEGPGMTIGGEMDIDAVIRRKPQLVIVDELAHTNPRNFRHQKRYQDVEELLSAGIDVYAALNVQHFESRSSVVGELSGIQVRETVPDSVLDMATEVELIDLTPEELIERLKSGQIYAHDKVSQALQGFFKRGTLTALREMALRITAEKVDHDVQDLIKNKELPAGTRNRSRLMVAIGPSPSGAELIRGTRQKAYNLEAPWIVVYVDSGRRLSRQEEDWVDSNLSLARELGAEIITTSGSDVSQVLLQVARSKHVTDLVLGRPASTFLTKLFREVSPVEKLFRESGGIDISLVDTKRNLQPTLKQLVERRIHSSPIEYAWAALTIVAALGFNAAIVPYISYQATGLVFLLAILVQSLYTGRGPVLLSAFVSALAWNFFYTEPRFTLHISSVEDKILVTLYFVTAVVVGTLTSRMRAQREAFRRRDQQSTLLLSFSKIFTETTDSESLINDLGRRLKSSLESETAVYIARESGLELHSASTWIPEGKDLAVAEWVLTKVRRAGKDTETLPEATGTFYPLSGQQRALGVIGFRHTSGRGTSLDERGIYEFLSSLLEHFLNRKESLRTNAYAQALEESEKLHLALLNSISHEIKTPLTAIGGAGLALRNSSIAADANNRAQISQEILTAWTRLRHLVDNLLDMSRLESGLLRPRPDWVDLNEVLEVVLRELPDGGTDSSQISVKISDDFPLVRADFGFLEIIIKNLLSNALRHGKSKSPVTVEAFRQNDKALVRVVDFGPGVSNETRPHIFSKFHRSSSSQVGGLGLGLSICKGFIEVLGGSIELEESLSGASFLLTLPIQEELKIVEES